MAITAERVVSVGRSQQRNELKILAIVILVSIGTNIGNSLAFAEGDMGSMKKMDLH